MTLTQFLIIKTLKEESMLNANELRLGNLIARAETNEQTRLTTNVPVIVDLEILTAIHNRPNPPYKGIVLTEEWLGRLGFTENDKNEYWHSFKTQNNFYCLIAMDMHEPMNIHKGDIIAGPCDTQVRFVHELQNLYYSMVGKELNVKL